MASEVSNKARMVELFPGAIVQLSPFCKNRHLSCCMMVVGYVQEWGVEGYIQETGRPDKLGGQIWYCATWEEFMLVGKAYWLVDSVEDLADKYERSKMN